jgi:hypothetical protein
LPFFFSPSSCFLALYFGPETGFFIFPILEHGAPYRDNWVL